MRDRRLVMNNPRDNPTSSIGRKIAIIVLVGITMLLFGTSATSVNANVFSKLGQMYGCIVTWGQVCDLSDTVTGTGPAPQPIPVTCAPPLLNGLPQFLSWPKGSAKYRFQGTCSSPAKPGAVMTVRWEGSWTPSETKKDRPNASETLQITGFEPFLPDRAPGGKIFMYWTARCTEDPWLKARSTGKSGTGQLNDFNSALQAAEKRRRGLGQLKAGQLSGLNSDNPVAKSDGCIPFGAYVPDDLRQALPDIDKQSFPRTGSIISAADKERLKAEYQRANPSYSSRMGIQPNPSSKALQQATIPQSSGIVMKPNTNLKLFSRGTDTPEQAQPDNQGQPDVSPEVPSSPVVSDGAAMDIDPPVSQVTITFDHPLHFMSAEGEDTLIGTGVYEIEPVLDLQLSLAREGQATVLLPTNPGTHSETIQQPMALLIQGESNDEQHLVLMTPDGKRFDAPGSLSGMKSRGTGMTVGLPNRKLQNAIIQYKASPPAGRPAPCQPNPLSVGPRNLPIPCTLSSGLTYTGDPTFGGGLPAPPASAPTTPYVDGSNVLHACLNNNTGGFRIVRPSDACATQNGEVKIKWQLAP